MPEIQDNNGAKRDNLIKRLTASMTAGLTDAVIGQKTHIDRHYGQSQPDILNRVIKNRKDEANLPVLTNSSFDNEETARKAVTEMILDNVEQIADWYYGTEEYRLTMVKPARTTEKSENDKPCGVAITRELETGKLRKYEADRPVVALQRNWAMPFGFEVITAFPVPQPDAKPLREDLREDMRQTETYKNAGPTYKAYLDYIANPAADTPVRFKHAKYQDQQMITMTGDKGLQCTVTFMKGRTIVCDPDISYSTQTSEGSQLFAQRHPELVKTELFIKKAVKHHWNDRRKQIEISAQRLESAFEKDTQAIEQTCELT